MKKNAVLFLMTILSCTICMAEAVALPASASMSASYYSSRISIPTGVFFNGVNFVKVENSRVRIVINKQMKEYDIRHSEIDPRGNYALVLSNGDSITIYSNGRSLYYNGTTYSKKSYY